MKRTAPAFQFYADDFLAGTFDMTAEETGVYIKLLCLQWSKGVVNPNLDKLAAAIVGSNKATLEAVLDAKFTEGEDGWRNERLEQVRSSQVERSEQARKAANKRWGNADASNQHDAEHADQHMPGQCTPSPSPSPRRIDVDIDLLEIAEERLTLLRKVMPAAASEGDRRLAWVAAVLSATTYSENWLVDSLEGVRATKPRKPWAYLTKCLRTKAGEFSVGWDAARKAVPPRPKPPPDSKTKRPRPHMKMAPSVDSEAKTKNAIDNFLSRVG